MNVKEEILKLEEALRLAELGPDAAFFEQHIADNAIIVSDGVISIPKSKIVDVHRARKSQKFSSVEMKDMQFYEHGNAVVVTCTGIYKTTDTQFSLSFMRVWVKEAGRWQIIAGTISSK